MRVRMRESEISCAARRRDMPTTVDRCCVAELSPDNDERIKLTSNNFCSAPTGGTANQNAAQCVGPCADCGPNCCTPTNRRDTTAVVMQTHVVTNSVLDRIRLAKRQLNARQIAFFVNFLVGDGLDAACPKPGVVGQHHQLDALREAIGSESVWCIAPQDYTAVWPTFFNRTVEGLANVGATRQTYPKASAISGLHWSWLFCDVHGMVGAMRNGLFASAEPPAYLWVWDYDISWAGDVAAFVDAFADERADLLVTRSYGQAISTKNKQGQLIYSQFHVRTYLNDEDVRNALLAPVRYSRRMLAATRKLIHAGRGAFCETRGASLCGLMRERWNCTESSMMHLRPDLFNANFSCCKSHSDRYSRERANMWNGLPAATRPPVQLLHRVKLEGPPVGVAASLRTAGGATRGKTKRNPSLSSS